MKEGRQILTGFILRLQYWKNVRNLSWLCDGRQEKVVFLESINHKLVIQCISCLGKNRRCTYIF